MTMNFRSSLGRLLFLWISLGLTATGQTPHIQLSGAYDCSAPGFAKQKLIFLSGGRWVKSPLFDPAAFKMRWISEQTRSYGGTMLLRQREHGRRGLGLRGSFHVEKDHVTLYPLPSERMHMGPQSFFDDEVFTEQQFRIDPASGNLIEMPFLGNFRSRLTCTRDGFF